MPIIKSIYWEQTNREELVYKFPFSSITTGSILTVNESQEAFFFKSGVLCDSFTAGRHILSSANLPLLHKIIELQAVEEPHFPLKYGLLISWINVICYGARVA